MSIITVDINTNEILKEKKFLKIMRDKKLILYYKKKKKSSYVWMTPSFISVAPN